MVTLNFKLIPVFIFYVIHLSENSETHNDTHPKKKLFDFRDVIKENSGYSPFADRCSLRIYGGKAAKISDLPYQVVIRRGSRLGDRWVLLCGGSIITHLYVLTAAHCFERSILRRLRYIRVVAGAEHSEAYILKRPHKMEFLDYMDNAELWRKVEYCYKHAWYNPRYIIHDFAVIEMDKPVHYSKSIQPIPMMRNNLGIKFEENGLCLVSGYGLMDYRQPSPTLRMVCVPVVSTARCNRIYGRGTVRSYQVCAGDRGRDSCQGDSGGPLTYHGYLIGIVSYGGRCGEAPGVYSLVSAYTTGENVPFIRNRCIRITYSPINILLVLVFIYFG